LRRPAGLETQEHDGRLFGYIHPYPDGNGRMARFLMNAMLASGGYPWTVIRVEDRAPYLSALDRASIELSIRAVRRLPCGTGEMVVSVCPGQHVRKRGIVRALVQIRS
jgi:hypothetical protein